MFFVVFKNPNITIIDRAKETRCNYNGESIRLGRNTKCFRKESPQNKKAFANDCQLCGCLPMILLFQKKTVECTASEKRPDSKKQQYIY